MDNFYLERTFAEVVGVVGDVRFRQLGSPPIPVVYFPYTQRPQRIQFAATVLVEAADGDPESVVQSLRSIVQRLEPDVPLRPVSQASLVGDSVAAREFTMMLLTGFSLVALALAVVGIYGVVSYSVARRTREMGIRLALGADPSTVLRMVMGASLRMVTGGLVLGTIGALLVGRLMRGLLYGVAPTDPVAVLAGVVLLGSAAALASWLPARVSTRVDPLVAMRAE
jgi:ABC-type antimicrobial peptide transport system permease subunit